MKSLILEANENHVDKTIVINKNIIMTPPIDGEYWLFRVKLDNDQAVLGFSKFGTIGIGFAFEEDWNTNLPYTSDTEMIYNHIKHNKKPSLASKKKVIDAIEKIQDAANKFMKNM